jgi:hypothetical protein
MSCRRTSAEAFLPDASSNSSVTLAWTTVPDAEASATARKGAPLALPPAGGTTGGSIAACPTAVAGRSACATPSSTASGEGNGGAGWASGTTRAQGPGSAEVPVLSSRVIQETVLRYRIDYSPEAEDHLEALTARLSSVVLDAVERQLTHQPTVPARNRKPPSGECRRTLGASDRHLRVYYEVQDVPSAVVIVKAVDIKVRNTVRIGNEEVKL